MRVLHIINSLATGGAEKLILETIPLYISKGMNVDVLLLDGTRYPFYDELQNSDAKIMVLSMGSVYNPLHIVRLIRFLKKYDVIHAHLFPTLYWVSIAKLFIVNKPKLVFSEHNTFNRRNSLFWRRMDMWIYERFDRIIAISKGVQKTLINKYKSLNTKIEVIPNAVDLHKIYQARSLSRVELNKSDSSFLLLQVSSFTQQKDHDTLFKAMTKLDSCVHLILVGNGPEQNKMINLVETLNLEDRVTFLGARMDVPSLLKTADIVILSSHYEGLSLSSIEGLASGKPFIASNVPGLKEVVSGAGVLFEHKDHLDLAEKINELIENPEHYKRVAQACLERSKKYSLEKMVDAHIKLYEELCQNPS